jgi:ABC-type arginine transport system ATPase subunit
MKPKGPSNETKAQKFRRLANLRMPGVIGKMRSVRNLANNAQYDFSQAQADKIVAVLQKEVDAIETAFTSSKEDKADTFSI